VIEFSIAENVNPTNINRRLQTIYGNESVDKSMVFRRVSTCKFYELGKMNIPNKNCDERPVTVFDKTHRIQVDELIKK